MEKRALFCYGTLQSPLVMKAVTGQSYNGQEATLNNWARFRVRGSEYPGIIRKEESAVPGKVYWDLDEPTMEMLDEFEGEKYERVIVEVTMADGTIMDAWAYAIKDDCKKMLSDDPWILIVLCSMGWKNSFTGLLRIAAIFLTGAICKHYPPARPWSFRLGGKTRAPLPHHAILFAAGKSVLGR